MHQNGNNEGILKKTPPQLFYLYVSVLHNLGKDITSIYHEFIFLNKVLLFHDDKFNYQLYSYCVCLSVEKERSLSFKSD